MRRLFGSLVLALFVVSMVGCGARSPAAFANTDITGADFGRSFTGLYDQHKQSRSLADFQGKAVIVFFGYTSCPDVCPTTLSRFSRVMSALGQDAGRVQVLLVTVDPERDTPEKLGTYVEAFNPGFLALSGDLPSTQATAKEFKVFFAKTNTAAGGEHHHHEGMDMSGGQNSGQNYMVDHSAGAYVFDPKGRIRLYVKDDVGDEAIVSDLKQLLAGA